MKTGLSRGNQFSSLAEMLYYTLAFLELCLFWVPWGSPDNNAYLRAKLKVSVFENGQFSGHLIFDKKTFFSEKKFFLPRLFKKKKKTMFLFLKKNVFSKIFFF